MSYQLVIPGRAEGANPEPKNIATRHCRGGVCASLENSVFMGSGLPAPDRIQGRPPE